MNGLHMRGGRYISPGPYASDAERLHAVEIFLAKYSQETEYALERLENEVTELQTGLSQTQSREVTV